MDSKIHKWEYEHAHEEYECANIYLDELEIPREDDRDTFSLVGRIKRLEARYLKELSDLETEYLRK